jgi:hypothetical protein
MRGQCPAHRNLIEKTGISPVFFVDRWSSECWALSRQPRTTEYGIEATYMSYRFPLMSEQMRYWSMVARKRATPWTTPDTMTSAPRETLSGLG